MRYTGRQYFYEYEFFETKLTDLHSAVLDSDLQQVQYLLEQQSDRVLERTGDHHLTLLHLAVLKEDLRMIAYLLKRPDVELYMNLMDIDFCMPIFLASDHDKYEVVVFFLMHCPLDRLCFYQKDSNSLLNAILCYLKNWQNDYLFPKKQITDLLDRFLRVEHCKQSDLVLPMNRPPALGKCIEMQGVDKSRITWRSELHCQIVFHTNAAREKFIFMYPHPLEFAVELDAIEEFKIIYYMLPPRYSLSDNDMCQIFLKSLQMGSLEIAEYLFDRVQFHLEMKFDLFRERHFTECLSYDSMRKGAIFFLSKKLDELYPIEHSKVDAGNRLMLRRLNNRYLKLNERFYLMIILVLEGHFTAKVGSRLERLLGLMRHLPLELNIQICKMVGENPWEDLTWNKALVHRFWLLS